jgi:hypothetical protein
MGALAKVLLIVGAFALVALLAWLLYYRLRLTNMNVRKHGKRVEASVTRVTAELALFSRHGPTTSYFVFAEWEDPQTHIVHHFKSAAGGVQLPLNHPPGTHIDVLIDPKNPRRYEVILGHGEHGYV